MSDPTPPVTPFPTADRAEEILRAAYRAFNAREVDAAVDLMHPDVDWPNAWEGGRAVGRVAVRDYWQRQFDAISSKVEPEEFEHPTAGEVVVLVHQIVYDAGSGKKISEGSVKHRYRLDGDLIVRMDVEQT